MMVNQIKHTNESQCVKSVELFSGIGGFRLACDGLGIETVWANDIDPLSCQVYADAFGADTIAQGDIRELHDRVPPHDLLTAGFPCQPFSSAGKKLGIRDSRGTLFQEIVQILERHSPQWFVLENVKRLLTMEQGDHFATILLALSELDYFVEWRLLNATFFGLPQNRQRVVIVGTRMSDISSAKVSLATLNDLSSTIRHDLFGLQNYATWRDLTRHKKKFPTWGLCYMGRFYCSELEAFSEAKDLPTLASVLEENPPAEFFMDETTRERIKASVFVNRLVDGVRILYNQNGGARMGYTVFGTDGIAPTLTASHSRHYERYEVGPRYRRLTNIEYARLQGFPDNHCSVASEFNQYILYGNAVPVPLAKWAIAQVVLARGLHVRTLEPIAYSQMSLGL
ncbi:MAG: DNA (cytosine-5-)-methyltransferase [Phycisphaerae bacterium]|nr:DNA (cytosine-5-)-methyltransferase [Phycisphaerae bacterium]